MGKRIFSATLGALYLILVVYLGGWYYNLSVIGLMLISINEMYHAMRYASYKPLTYAGYSFIVLFLPVYYAKGILGIFILFTLISLVSMTFMVLGARRNFKDIMVTMYAIVYPVFPLTFLFFTKELKPMEVGVLALTIALVSSWATDTFAYFTGINYGKHPLCTQISPKKTIEGAIGGLIGSSIFSIVLGIILQRYVYPDILWIHYGILGLLSGFFAQLGDLSASAIKRYSGIKDFGNFFPGHGGVLDRFDSVLFTLPVVYSYFIFILC